MSVPGTPDGFTVGEGVVILVDFDSRRNVSVEGNPRLAIEIGEHVRLADFLPWPDWPSGRPRRGQQFEYRVRPDNLDVDGISIKADALDFSEGAFVSEEGVEITVDIRAVTSDHVTRDHALP